MSHRVVEDHVEELLAGRPLPAAAAHLEACTECRQMLAQMRRHAALIRTLQPPSDVELEPSPGFYARVMDRIDAQGPISIWNLFMETTFGRRIAVASLTLAVLMAAFLVTLDRDADREEQVLAAQPQIPFVMPDDSEPSFVVSPAFGAQGLSAQDVASQGLASQGVEQVSQIDPLGPGAPGQVNNDAVLVDLATYREQ